MSEQQAQLAKPFARKLVHTNPSGGGDYVSHSAVTEKVIAVVGPYKWECVDLIRGYVPGITANPSSQSKRGKEGRPALENAVVGYVGRLTLDIDGVTGVYEEPGDCEDPHNWPHDGARAKDAASDSFKRCAMRAGVGLHLWSQFKGESEFFLYDYLINRSPEQTAAPSQPKAAEFTRLYNARSAAERTQLRTLLVAEGIPSSVQEMTEDQARKAIEIATEERPR